MKRLGLGLLYAVLSFAPAYADELGPRVQYVPQFDQPWSDVPREVLGTWFESLHRDAGNDDEVSSCCGLGDAYEADLFDTENGKLFAIITDGREFSFHKRGENQTHTRKPIRDGTRFEVSRDSLVNTQGNPTGHGVIFISQSDLVTVYCYVLPRLF